MFESLSPNAISISSDVFYHANFNNDNRIVVVKVTKEMLEKYSTTESELEGIPSSTISIDGVDVGITLKERDNGTVRVSVRTTEKANASKICEKFEGGGHIRAAGCRFNGTIEQAEQQLVEVCIEALHDIRLQNI